MAPGGDGVCPYVDEQPDAEQQPGEPRRSDRRIEDEGHHDGEQQVAERMDQRVEAVIQVGVDISIGNTESECPAD